MAFDLSHKSVVFMYFIAYYWNRAVNDYVQPDLADPVCS